MGEYARDYILKHHGVDIGDDDDRPIKPKKHGCSCGRRFKFLHALEDHVKDTGHVIKKKETNDNHTSDTNNQSDGQPT